MVTKDRPNCDKQDLIRLNILSKPTKKTPKTTKPPKNEHKTQTWKNPKKSYANK